MALPFGNGGNLTYRGADGLPLIYNTKIRQAGTIVFDNSPTTTNPTDYAWLSGNDPHNWLRTAGQPTRPPYWDYLTNIYDQYYVPSCSISLRLLSFNDATRASVYMWAMPTASVAPKKEMNSIELRQMTGVKYRWYPGASHHSKNGKTMHHWCSTKIATGHPAPSADPEYHGQFIQGESTRQQWSPSEGWYWAIGITRADTPTSTDTYDWQLQFTITWRVMFFRRQWPAHWLQGIGSMGVDPDQEELPSDLPGELGDTDFPTV